MAGRTSSAYHQRCIAPSIKALEDTARRQPGEKVHPASAYRDCNMVAQERVWKEGVQKETAAAREWENRWGFTAEYDLTGNPVEKRSLPEKVSFYDTPVPHTTNQTIGASVESSHGRRMMELERLTCFRKRRTDIKDNYKYT